MLRGEVLQGRGRAGVWHSKATPEVPSHCHHEALVLRLTALDLGQSPLPLHQGPDSEMVFIMPTENKKNSPSVNRRKVLVKLLIILLLTK